MKLSIALDMANSEDNINLAKSIKQDLRNDILLKVGLRSYIRDGHSLVRILQDLGYRIFLDLKLYDIPNTMLDSIMECDKLKVNMLTIHASSGYEAMSNISKYLKSNNSNMKIIAVTALTSFDEASFMSVYNRDIESGVKNLASIAYKAGIDGVVCSLHEVGMIREISESLLTITPGIRLDSANDDQKRVATLDYAKKVKSDVIVVGRPIYKANNPSKIVEDILGEIRG